MSSSRRRQRVRDEAGYTTLVWLFLVFIPIAFLVIVPAGIELAMRYNASVRFHNCVQMTATGLRIWVAQNYPQTSWAALPVGTVTAQATALYSQTLCGRNIGISGLRPGWRVVSVTSPGAGAYTVTVDQPYTSPRGPGWFTSATWRLSETGWAYQHPAA